MKQLNTLLILLVSACFLQAQVRYLDQIFDEVAFQADIPYGTNISVLQAPTILPIPLTMDMYSPVGDDLEERPVIIYLHTGSFLPQYFNGGITGSKKDSTVVEICTRLAKMGYVVFAATYRQGWNPIATGPEGQNIRTGTLLNAAYRGIQDARTCIRFLRKEYATNNNPYGIDPEKIVLWGQGTGGYISLGAAFLDEFAEVNLEKFIDTETLLPYVDTNLNGNPYATTDKPLCLSNWVGYSSEFKMAINMGGALGDISWIDGDAGTNEEPALIGFHMVNDPFAPFADGPVIVPTTGDFVVNVSGTRTAVGRTNDVGSNDPLIDVNAALLTSGDGLTQLVQAFKPVVLPTPPFQPAGITLATDNMYPFRATGVSQFESGPWDWWDYPRLVAEIAFINAALGTNFDADVLHNNGLITNPNMSPEKARSYIDTVVAFYAPRGCAALGLADCCEALGIECATSVEEILDGTAVSLQIMPNPASERITIETDAAFPMLAVEVFNLSGQRVYTDTNINNHFYTLERGALPNGMYVIKLRFDKGISTQKVLFH
ncbi:MAG TPA: T9SS type A sorting domain-containing protein [Saprospiraceae bacterium]|nr:T9SS type A sorting domain-containing protein [Saprospiraceae bacterium]HMQ82977.1 T9SS type A sorting domain-containing protein [Saprospiraceae bacterium]